MSAHYAANACFVLGAVEIESRRGTILGSLFYTSDMSLSLNSDYKTFFADVKSRIQQAQVRASIKVNQELLLLYRQLGKRILEVQASAEW